MNKTIILEAAFDTINESMEWAFDSRDVYADYISGIVDMTNKMLEKAVPHVPKDCEF